MVTIIKHMVRETVMATFSKTMVNAKNKQCSLAFKSDVLLSLSCTLPSPLHGLSCSIAMPPPSELLQPLEHKHRYFGGLAETADAAVLLGKTISFWDCD